MENKRGFLYTLIERKTLVIILAVAILIAGVLSYFSLPKEEYPAVTMPMAIITTVYPGASAQDVEELITKKIEDLTMSAEGFDYVLSQTFDGVSVVQVYFDMSVDSDKIEKSKTDLRYDLETLQLTELPDGIIVNYNTNADDTDGLLLAFTGETQSMAELTQRAETLKKIIRNKPGVKDVTISGKLEEEVRVTVDVAKLNKTALSLSDIGTMIQYQNSIIPAGNIEFDTDKITVNTSGKFDSINEIEDIIISVSQNSGAITRLKDVAVIEMTSNADAKRYQYNGKDAVLMSLSYQDGINVVTAGQEILKAVDNYKSNLPEGIEVNAVVNLAADVNKSISNFTSSVLQAILIVLVVIMLGMSLRNGAIIAIAIPISIVIPIILMNVFGITIQFVSLAALIIALGMLVDNAVVVADTIQVRIDADEDKLSACVNGVKSVCFPVLASTMTTVSIFIMFYMLPGTMNEVVSSLPTIVISALLASYVVSMTITPIMCYLLMKKSKSVKEGKVTFIGKFGNIIDRLLQVAFKNKMAAIIIAVVLLIGSFGLLGTLDMEFMPKSEKTLVNIKITSTNLNDIRPLEEATLTVAEIVSEQPETAYYMSAVGGYLPKYDFSAIPEGDAVNKGNVVIGVDLKAGNRFKNNAQFVEYLQNEMNRKVPSCLVQVKEIGIMPETSEPIQVRIVGDDFEELNAAAVIIEEELAKIDGTENIHSDRQFQTQQYFVDIDDSSLNTHGLTKAELQGELNAALMGRQVSVFRKDTKEYPIIIKSNIHSLDDLQSLMVKSSVTGSKYQVKQLADVGLKEDYSLITRYNRKRSVTVSATPKIGYASIALQSELQKALTSKDLGNVTIEYDGDSKSMNDAMSSLIKGAGIGVIGIILVLYLQFNSFRKVFYVLCAIPFSFVGASLGLVIFKPGFSLFAIMGILSLFGVVVNNAIVLVDFINKERESGISVDEACKSAVARRFRPVFLSTMTAVLGMLPLAVSGNALFTGMAIAFMCGDALCMFFTLIIVPVVYGWWEGAIEKKERGVKEEVTID